MNARRISPAPSPAPRITAETHSPVTLPAPPDSALLAASGLPLFAANHGLPLFSPNEALTREIFDEYGPLEEVGPADEGSATDVSGVYEVQLSERDLLARAGSLECVPVVRKTLTQIKALPLDPASAFIVSAIDGMVSIEMLFDLAPMPRDQVVRALCLLFDHDVIALG